MLNPVIHFFGGKAAVKDQALAAVPVGSLQVLKADQFLIADKDGGDKVVRIGQKISTGRTAEGKWRISPIINAELITNAMVPVQTNSGKQVMVREFKAPTPCSYKFKAGSDVTAGSSIKLALVFKGVRDLSPQFLNTEFWATFDSKISTAKAAIAHIVYQIQNDPMISNKITAAAVDISTTPGLEITAKLPPYNKNQRYEWVPIEFEASLSQVYTTDKDKMFNRIKEWGTIEASTPGALGVGYGPVVCDMEKRALAYQVPTNTYCEPYPLNSSGAAATGYTMISIPISSNYRAADNQTRQTNEMIVIALLEEDPADNHDDFLTKIKGVYT